MSDERFDAASALGPLKAFQRRTVDYVFDRLFDPQDSAKQFLVADEVGLGKTMVARGVIARTIEHLWDRTKRIDILYICSNQAIARQNLRRLNVLGREELTLPTRMTLLPLQLRSERSLDANRVNFISLTPGTTFELKSSTGVAQERALLRRLLEDLVSNPRGLHNLLQVTSGPEGWNRIVASTDLKGIDPKILERFRKDVTADLALFDELERVCELFPRRRDSYPPEMTRPRNKLVTKLRAKLSYACVDTLQPDLIIMDEFQRFRDLLHGNDEAALLARELFDYSNEDGHAARTLLLSATPYRMLTLSGDPAEEGDHYRDFLETLSFLYGRERGPEVAKSIEQEMRTFRGLLRKLPSSHDLAVAARQTVEGRLRRVISRTERVANTAERDSMMGEKIVTVAVAPSDLSQAAAVARVAQAVDAPEIVEYWKSAPYLLNFMRHYSLKQLIDHNKERPPVALLAALQAARPAMLNRAAINEYAPLDPANGRMRSLIDDVFSTGLHEHLWIPPSLPYYGPAQSGAPVTKALVFSSWSMVPDSIAAILSYEAERRMGVGTSGRRYFEKHRSRPLQFRKDQGRLASLRTLLLVYPSPQLAALGDPLAGFCSGSGTPTYAAIRETVAARLRSSFDALRTAARPDGTPGAAEWAAPAIIDSLAGSNALAWLEAADGATAITSEGEEAFRDHVLELARTTRQKDFGQVSDDFIELLVDVALGSPAICAVRALRRIAPELAWDEPTLLGAAAKVAWAFRTLFNQHDVIALLRQGDEERYWHRVLTYGALHNLQAVLDEYAHNLVDSEGVRHRPPTERATKVAEAMVTALSIRPSQIEVDDLRVRGGMVDIKRFQMRGRFAMRLADYKDEENATARLGIVRDAFNSPFRPFVLATTSVGQEGLDFHPYCYRVYHWNLPSNPVDLEQREGRVHRFKGHAIRLNLAERQSNCLQRVVSAPADPWDRMFEQARSEASIDTDLVPYWIYEGSVKVERRVPVLPFSREITRLEWLKRSLTLYRLAFGQPRQDDLLAYLQKLAGDGHIEVRDLEDLQIHLEPLGRPPDRFM